jgi:hypothetical protein
MEACQHPTPRDAKLIEAKRAAFPSFMQGLVDGRLEALPETSNATADSLAGLVLEAQKIISTAAQPGANTEVAIQRLAALMCTPMAHNAVLDALGADGVRAAAASLA